MKIIRDFTSVDQTDRGASAAIGNFDGVHLGHQAVIDTARSVAPKSPLGVVTFEPHPRDFFGRSDVSFRLMNDEAKANRLKKLGVDLLYELRFDSALANLTAEEFARDVLSSGLGLQHVVIGADFRFGKGRLGNAAMLEDFGRRFGFGVTVAELIDGHDGQISSTNIRQALSDGQPDAAAKMLGYWHRIEGQVIQGDQRGRDLGYPTANLTIQGLHQPRFGVYAVQLDILDGLYAGSYHGAASIGVRPMFGENQPNCETYIFDFSGDIYGAHISVALVEFLRGEEKFNTLDALVTQMQLDCARARTILSAT